MKQYHEDEEDDSQDQGTSRGFDTKEPDEANQRQIHPSGSLLQRAGVNQALSIDFGVIYEQQVISISQVYQEQPYSSESKYEWCDDRIGDGYT